jgi:excisionase family DNA binding protein
MGTSARSEGMKRGNRSRTEGSKSGAPYSEIMTLRDVAHYLDCHPFTIGHLARQRVIPAFRLGSDWRFRRSDLEKWIDGETVVVSEIEPEKELRKGNALKLRKPRPSPHRAKKPGV